MITRIIPRLDIKGPNLVKGIHLEGLRVLGKPEFFARKYYEEGADELLFVDVVASLYGRNSLLEIIRSTADEIFVPLAVGGGLRSLDDIRAVLRVGADKVSLNTAAVRRPELVREAARRFGSSTIMVSIEAIRRPDGIYEAYTDNGREKTGLEVVAWAQRAAELGAGELLVTSIDREGTGRGYDVELTRRVAESVPVPVIACGGAGSVRHVAEVLAGGAAAASLASVLHYDLIRRFTAQRDQFAAEINLAHLQRPGFARIQDASLADLKSALARQGIESRPLVAHV
ncbi:MAG: imidazole glycerol phosphate synthase subunit HisF [Gemmatimonadales bacterium]